MVNQDRKLSYADLSELESAVVNQKMLRRIAEVVFTKDYFKQKAIPFGTKKNGKNKGYVLKELFKDDERLSRVGDNVKMNQRNLALLLGSTQPTLARLLKDLGIKQNERAKEQYSVDEKVALLADRLTAYEIPILDALAQGWENRKLSENVGERDLDAYGDLTEEERLEWRMKKQKEREEEKQVKRNKRERLTEERKEERKKKKGKKNDKVVNTLDVFADKPAPTVSKVEEQPKAEPKAEEKPFEYDFSEFEEDWQEQPKVEPKAEPKPQPKPQPQPKPKKSQLSKKSENQTKNDKKGGLNDKEILGLVSNAINNLAQLVKVKKVTENDAYAYADLFEDMYRMIKESARFNEWESGEALSKNFFAFSNGVRKTQKVPLPVISKRVTRVVKSSETTPRQLLKQRMNKKG